MTKKVSNNDRKKIVAKFGGNTFKKKTKLKHPPKFKKNQDMVVSVQGDVHLHSSCCKKSMIPLNGKEYNVNGHHPKIHVPKKVKIVSVSPIHVGGSVL